MNGGDRWRAAGAMTADTAQCSAGITLARVAQCDPLRTVEKCLHSEGGSPISFRAN